MSAAICPDCAYGKHAACQGDAWDHDTDQPAVCACWADNHGGAA